MRMMSDYLKHRCFMVGILFLLVGVASDADAKMPSSPPHKVLTSVEEIRKLSLEEAASNIPVLLEGVITYSEPNQPFAFLQDETGGIFFCRNRFPYSIDSNWPSLEVGDHVQIKGLTDSGDFSPLIIIPEITPSSLIIAGKADLPKPASPPLKNLLQTQLHNQWVDLNAILTGYVFHGGFCRLTLNIGGLPFEASLLSMPPNWAPPENWMHSEMNLQGVYEAQFNRRKQMVTFVVKLPSLDYIKPIKSDESQLFDKKPISLQELLTFRSPARVLVKGVVLIHLPGEGFYMRCENETGGLWVQADIKEKLMPGQEVFAVGQPTFDQIHPSLKDSVVRLGVQRSTPKPRQIKTADTLSVDLDGDLITFKAKLVESITLPGSVLMVTRHGDTLLTAQSFSTDDAQNWPELLPGSWIEFTGVLTVRSAGLWFPITPNRSNILTRVPDSFSLLLRGPSDIKIIQVPRWWTIKRVAFLTASISILTIATLIWVALLRFRVKKQTELISSKIERESIQEERSRIARDLHDTLQQNLTGIMLQISHAQKRLSISPDTVFNSLETAHSMAKHSFEEVEYTVWNLHSSTCSPAKIGPALQEMLDSIMLQQSGQSGPEITINTHEPDFVLPGVILSQVLNIVREAVTNVIRHAKAKTIDISMRANSTTLEIRIKDDGMGFDTTKTDSVERSHFGLISMKERAGKINASLDITSELGKGTNVFLSLELTKIKMDI